MIMASAQPILVDSDILRGVFNELIHSRLTLKVDANTQINDGITFHVCIPPQGFIKIDSQSNTWAMYNPKHEFSEQEMLEHILNVCKNQYPSYTVRWKFCNDIVWNINSILNCVQALGAIEIMLAYPDLPIEIIPLQGCITDQINQKYHKITEIQVTFNLKDAIKGG